MEQQYLIAALMFLGAALYSSVGHAGASAYLSIMALFGVPAVTMRATALSLNVAVASLASFRYVRAGYFDRRVFLLLALGSVPWAFVGGAVSLPGHIYRPLVGLVLIFAAVRLLWPRTVRAEAGPAAPAPWYLLVPAGALIGLLSGLTGTGGGIFLSPLILFLGWASVRDTSGISAAFILVNSVAGLLGNLAVLQRLPPEILLYLPAVVAGGFIGTWLGTSRLDTAWLMRALALVLLIAGGKLLFS